MNIDFFTANTFALLASGISLLGIAVILYVTYKTQPPQKKSKSKVG